MFVFADHRFGGVEKGIHPLICRKLRRHAHHQIGVDDGQDREHGREEDARLFLNVIFTDDRRHVDFTARSGRRRNGNRRGCRISRLFLAAFFRKAVIPNIAVVGHHQGDALGAVHDRSAAEGDDEVTACIPGHLSAVHDVVIRRIGTHLVKDFIADAGQI